MVTALPDMPSPTAGAREALLPLADVGVDPARFQPRGVEAGKSYNADDVATITENYHPELFDAVLVVPDPAHAGKYLVVAGHHRRQAAEELSAAGRFATPGQIPARVLDIDISTPEGLQRAQDRANQTNTGVASLSPKDIIKRLRALQARGQSHKEISREFRTLKRRDLDDYLYLANLDDPTIDIALQYPGMRDVGVVAGRAMAKHGMSAANAHNFVRLYQLHATQKNWSPPPQPMLMAAIDAAYARRKQEKGAQAGFGDVSSSAFNDADLSNTALTGVLQHVEETRRAEKERQAMMRRMSSCEAVAEEMGIDVSDLRAKVDAAAAQRVREREQAYAAALRAYSDEEYIAAEPAPAALKMPGEPEPAPPQAGAAMTNLFGEAQEFIAPVADDEYEARKAADIEESELVSRRLQAIEDERNATPEAAALAIVDAAEDGVLYEAEVEALIPPLPDNAGHAECQTALVDSVVAQVAAQRVAETAEIDLAAAEAELAQLAASTGLPTPEQLPPSANGIKLAADAETVRTYHLTKPNDAPPPTPDMLEAKREAKALAAEERAAASFAAPTTDTDETPDFAPEPEPAPGAGQPLDDEPPPTRRRQPITKLSEMKPANTRWENLGESDREQAVGRYNQLLARIAIAQRSIRAAELVTHLAEHNMQKARECQVASGSVMGAGGGGGPTLAPAELGAPLPVVSKRVAAHAVRQGQARGAGPLAARIENAARGRKGRRKKHSDPFGRPDDIPAWAKPTTAKRRR